MSRIFCTFEDVAYAGMIARHRYWTVIVSRELHTLGTLVVFLNRHTVRFSSLSGQELEELQKKQKNMEPALDSLFFF